MRTATSTRPSVRKNSSSARLFCAIRVSPANKAAGFEVTGEGFECLLVEASQQVELLKRDLGVGDDGLGAFEEPVLKILHGSIDIGKVHVLLERGRNILRDTDDGEDLASFLQVGAGGVEKVERHGIHPEHAGDVEQEVVGARGILDHAPGDALGLDEAEFRLQFIDRDQVAVAVDDAGLFLAADALGVDLVAAIHAAEGLQATAAILEEVEAEAAGDVLADLDAAQAVADRIEARGEDADAELARQHGGDAATYPALGGQADIELPAAGIIVHAAGVHDREHRAHIGRAHGTFAGHRVEPAIGERGADHGEIARA